MREFDKEGVDLLKQKPRMAQFQALRVELQAGEVVPVLVVPNQVRELLDRRSERAGLGVVAEVRVVLPRGRFLRLAILRLRPDRFPIILSRLELVRLEARDLMSRAVLVDHTDLRRLA